MQRKNTLEFPSTSVPDLVDGKKGECDDLQELCALDVLRSKRD